MTRDSAKPPQMYAVERNCRKGMRWSKIASKVLCGGAKCREGIGGAKMPRRYAVEQNCLEGTMRWSENAAKVSVERKCLEGMRWSENAVKVRGEVKLP